MIGDNLVSTVKDYMTPSDAKKVVEALEFARKYHKKQTRKSGDPYIVHPVAVALPLAQLKFDSDTVCAALLHDVPEDTEATLQMIEKAFGKDIERLVDGLTKLEQNRIHFHENLEGYSVENLRKMFLAMAQDLRVVIIKLSDRLHNLQTLFALPRESQVRIAQETMSIYAPLASRLGMGWLKGMLEDLSFSYIDPVEFKRVKNVLIEAVPQKEALLIGFQKELSEKLPEQNVEIIEMHGRVKRVYSLYKKLDRHENNIDRIYDLVAVRILVPTVSDCYKVLGIIHEYYKPLLGRIKDYIATPKTNGYKSLHTTVLTRNKEVVEVQIRTPQMHHEAEYGVAATWHYDESGKTNSLEEAPHRKLLWIKQLAEWQRELSTTQDFKESLAIDFFKDRIFVFTPKGDILDLPDSASLIDFAYGVHTDVGHACTGAKVNDKIVRLNHKLKNGDRVEVMTGNHPLPKHYWLTFVKTSHARTAIKQWFKKKNREETINQGSEALDRKFQRLHSPTLKRIKKAKKFEVATEFNYKSFDDVLVAVGQGDLSVDSVIRALTQEKARFQFPTEVAKRLMFFPKPEKRAFIEGEKGILSNIAHCCNPGNDDPILAYITRSKGASVHKSDCRELKKPEKEGRIVNASWDSEYESLQEVGIEIISLDRVGLIKDMTTSLAERNVNIIHLSHKRRSKNDTVSLQIIFEVKSDLEMFEIMEELETIPEVISVKKRKKSAIGF